MREQDRACPASRRAMTRRRFLVDSAKGAATAGLASALAPSMAQAAEEARPTARVVIVTHPDVLIKGYQADSGVLSKMLEAGIKALTGKQSDKDAWQEIAQPGQRVTMKWNEMGWRPIQTHPELRNVMAGALVRHGGLQADKIVQFSRADVKGPPARLVKVALATGAKPAKLRRLFTHFTDCLINLPVLKTHRSKGISVSLKNHFGSIVNPRDYHYWEAGMGENIVELNLCPAIKDKTRLVICDALRPQWDQGPLHAPGRRWNENALIFGVDPVAVDAVGLDILEKKRKTISSLRRKWRLPYASKMLAYAQQRALGVADLKRIEIERIALKA